MPKTLTAGDLRERIALYEFTAAEADGFTTYTTTALTAYTAVHANIRQETEGERIRAGRTEARQTVVVTVRKEIPITPELAFTWLDGALWNVLTYPAAVDHRRRFQRFVAVRTDNTVNP